MQLLIDTLAISERELGALINYLDDILTIRRSNEKAPEPTAANDQPKVTAAPLAPMPPPPPPKMIDSLTVTLDGDPDVEFDDEGGVTAGAGAPPPPPPPLAMEHEASAPPAPPVPAPPGPAVPAELDSKGMPYDARIHASNRAKTIEKVWKYKRGVAKELIASCEAQNKAGNAPTPVVSTTAAPARPTALGAASPATSAGTAPPPPPPPPLMAGGAAPAAAVPSAIDFRGLMQKIQAASAAGKLTDAQINEAFATVGLKPEDMGQLINNAPLIASVNAAIDAVVK